MNKIDVNRTDCYNQVQNYVKYLRNRIAFLEKKQCDLPNATIKYLSRGRSVSFYKRIPGKKVKVCYIKHANKEEITKVANASYVKRVLPKLKKNLYAAEKFLDLHSGTEEREIVNAMPDFIKELNNNLFVYKPTYIKNWQDQPYIRNPNKPEGLIHETMRGDMVRSKSEVLLADELYEHNLAYRPECPLRLKKSGRTIYPDFLILHPETFKEIIWEHFGMMDDPDYAREAFAKINALARDGYFMGDNLICTFERSDMPLTRGTIELYIEKYFKIM